MTERAYVYLERNPEALRTWMRELVPQHAGICNYLWGGLAWRVTVRTTETPVYRVLNYGDVVVYSDVLRGFHVRRATDEEFANAISAT